MSMYFFIVISWRVFHKIHPKRGPNDLVECLKSDAKNGNCISLFKNKEVI